MPILDATALELLEHTEFLTIVTEGPDGPHLVGNWGDYLRKLGVESDRIVLPAGHYEKTDANLRRNERIQVMVASRAVRGTRAPGQGCVIRGTATVQTEGELAERVKAAFGWARGALVIRVESFAMQL